MLDTLEETEEGTLFQVEIAPEEVYERRSSTRTSNKPRVEPNYHVIIWNDEEHTYEYVMELLCTLFSYPVEKAFQITVEVDKSGKGVAYTCHKELAELKLEQIMGFGADPRMPKESKGSIRATIEPAPG